MYASHDPIHYFIVRKNPPAQAVPDLILSEEGAVNVTAEDLDFSGRTFRRPVRLTSRLSYSCRFRRRLHCFRQCGNCT